MSGAFPLIRSRGNDKGPGNLFRRNIIRPIQMLSRLVANTVYVQVRKNAFRLRHIESKKERDATAQAPFTTARLLVGQFREAASLLRKAIRELASGGLFQVSPVVVIHPTEMVEGGLSEVEERVFRELALGAGARRAIVHVGPTLTDAEVTAMSRNRPRSG